MAACLCAACASAIQWETSRECSAGLPRPLSAGTGLPVNHGGCCQVCLPLVAAVIYSPCKILCYWEHLEAGPEWVWGCR